MGFVPNTTQKWFSRRNTTPLSAKLGIRRPPSVIMSAHVPSSKHVKKTSDNAQTKTPTPPPPNLNLKPQPSSPPAITHPSIHAARTPSLLRKQKNLIPTSQPYPTPTPPNPPHHQQNTTHKRTHLLPTYLPTFSKTTSAKKKKVTYLVHHRPDLPEHPLHLRHEHPHVVHQGARPRRVAHGRDGRGGDVLRLRQVLGLGAERRDPRGVPPKPLVPARRPPVVVNLKSRPCVIDFERKSEENQRRILFFVVVFVVFCCWPGGGGCGARKQTKEYKNYGRIYICMYEISRYSSSR